MNDLVRFIKRNVYINENKIASELFNPNIKHIKYFLSESYFPPPWYQSEDWLDFFEDLGLQTKISRNFIIEEAKSIEQEWKSIDVNNWQDYYKLFCR